MVNRCCGPPPFELWNVTWTHSPTVSEDIVAGAAPSNQSPDAACRPTHRGCKDVMAPYQPSPLPPHPVVTPLTRTSSTGPNQRILTGKCGPLGGAAPGESERLHRCHLPVELRMSDRREMAFSHVGVTGCACLRNDQRPIPTPRRKEGGRPNPVVAWSKMRS